MWAANAQQQAKQKAQILSTNVRASSHGTAGVRPHISREASGSGLLAQQSNYMSGSAGGMYPHQPLQMMSAASTPLFGMNGANAYFASPTAFHNNPGMMGYPQQASQFPAMMNPLTYQAFAGGTPMMMTNYGYPMAAGFGYGMPQMPYGPGMAPEEPLDPTQRDAIDQWRLSVAQ